MHRVVWNLAWGPPGISDNNEPDDGEGRFAHPPRVPPGTYTVELEVNAERVSSAPLTVIKDPRSPATQAQFVQQFERSRQIFRDSLESRHALSDIARVKEELDQILANPDVGDVRALTKAKELRADLDAMVQGNSGLDAATMKLITALNAVESSDRPAPSQALAVYKSARIATRERLEQWAAIKAGALATLREELQAQGLSPVSVP